MGVDTTPSPSKDAVTLALTVGFIIPILSVIPPIQTALAKNLNESLDLKDQRLKQSISKYWIQKIKTFGLI